jgi:hypothetical protein
MEIEAGTNAEEQTTPHLLTRQQVLASFQFSQGDLHLQTTLLRYLKAADPLLSLPPEEQDPLLQATLPSASFIAHDQRRYTPEPMPAQRIREALREALRAATAICSPLAPPDPATVSTREQLVASGAQHVLERDLRFLRMSSGRGYISDTSGHYNPYKDRWRSDLCYFGFLGHTTSLPGFDQFFAEVAAYWRTRFQRGDRLWHADLDCLYLIDLFNHKHVGSEGMSSFHVESPLPPLRKSPAQTPN